MQADMRLEFKDSKMQKDGLEPLKTEWNAGQNW